MKVLLSTLLCAASIKLSVARSLRGPSTQLAKDTRRQLNSNYYFSITDTNVLGAPNVEAAIGNPLKGLLTSPRWTNSNTPDSIPSSLEFYYFGLDEIMRGIDDFDWTVLDASLAEAESRNNHVIWRVFCHYPGQPLRVPQFLIDAGVSLVTIPDGASPQYDDQMLLEAFENFITAWGARYDGHKTVGFIQLGLLGKWGEWHTFPEENLLSAETKDKVVGWFETAFPTTQLQIRTPLASAYAAGMGLHDDSFAYSTLGETEWFFWPEVEKAGQVDSWKKGATGGETRPELQDTIFKPEYQAGSDEFKQDFMQCVEVTKATYMFHHSLFLSESLPTGIELENARHAHASMGYNFQVTSVGVAESAPGLVAVDVTLTQTGVAPFYYPLSIVLSCPGTEATLDGADTLIETGSSMVFSFQDIPADLNCLDNVGISLQSSHVHEGRPIKFAQGSDGIVKFKLPLSTNGASASAPVTVPTLAPVVVVAPTTAPVVPPTAAPIAMVPPSGAPVAAPTVAPLSPVAVSITTETPVAVPTNAPVTTPTGTPVTTTLAPVVAVPTSAPKALEAGPATSSKAPSTASRAPTIVRVAVPVPSPTTTTTAPASLASLILEQSREEATGPTAAPNREPKLFAELFWAYAQGKTP